MKKGLLLVLLALVCLLFSLPTNEVEAAEVDADAAVKLLFEEYYNNGTYTKDSVLNVNSATMEEVQVYFHNSQDVRYRKTEYTPEGLTMTTSVEGTTYENESTYTNGNNCVNHTGFGGDWTVTEYTSVEEWFVTLKDFSETTLTGWTVEGGVYTYALTATTLETEHAMTTMAREFVAPMWLAPNADNYNYVTFTKLTVENTGKALVMKLYVSEGNSGQLVENSNLIFSQATITYTGSDVINTAGEALKASSGKVKITGVVDAIYQAYNSSYNNISVYITDETGRILAYRLTGNVTVGTVITVEGSLTDYNGTMQIAQGCKFTVVEEHSCYMYTEVSCSAPSSCVVCGEHRNETVLPHDYVTGVCSVCGGIDPDYEGAVTYPSVETVLKLSFTGVANKANGDTYFKTNYADWTITNTLGQTYAGYLGFGRSGSSTSAITSSQFTATSDFELTTVLKGNGSSGVATSTVTFKLLDAAGNVIATGYANGSTTSAITPVDAKDTTYTISFTYVDGKTYADAAKLQISFAKATGNIGLKSLVVA